MHRVCTTNAHLMLSEHLSSYNMGTFRNGATFTLSCKVIAAEALVRGTRNVNKDANMRSERARPTENLEWHPPVV